MGRPTAECRPTSSTLKLHYDNDESREGVNALKEKRKPEFRKFAK